jgi:drug/metabolite transporter (DMT)-like permease
VRSWAADKELSSIAVIEFCRLWRQLEMPRPPGISKVMSGADWLMLISLSLLWGGSFFFNDVAVRELPTITVVTARVGLAAVVLLLVARIGATKPLAKLPWSAFLVMGVLNNAIPFLLIVWAQAHIASGLAAILNATTPLFTLIVAHLFTADERLTWGRAFGVILGLAGVIVIVGPDALHSLGTDVAAQLACLGAALSYAFAAVFGRRFAALGVSPIETAAGQTAAAALLLIPLMFIVDRPWLLPMPSSATIGALIGIGILSTVLAYILYFRILASAGATNLLTVTFLIPISAIVLGFVFLDETPRLRHFAGLAFIGCGLAAIDGRVWRTLSTKRPNPAP